MLKPPINPVVNTDYDRTASPFYSVDCGVPDDIPNASKILSGNVEGKIVTYQCLEKFGFDDGSSEVNVTCLSTGKWEEVDQQCLRE